MVLSLTKGSVIENPCRARDEVNVFGPTSKKREPLHIRGVHVRPGAESLKRLRGTHLGGQVQKADFTRHMVGVNFLCPPEPFLRPSIPPQ